MMGFLFDENLPRVLSLPTSLPVIHALDLGCRLTDSQIWTHAEQHDLVIVTKDADFSSPDCPPACWEHAPSRFRRVAGTSLATD
jgi:predicted nuclease of predicted toxin-antitoxin system